jgi:hypothetical protein
VITRALYRNRGTASGGGSRYSESIGATDRTIVAYGSNQP